MKLAENRSGRSHAHGRRHARSVAAAAIDGVTGELFQTKLTPAHDHIRGWLQGLPGPVAVTYEAGPTGFGLYRALTQAGIRCLVAAPSKLQRPAGDRVKTDARDAIHLARLLRMDEVTAVAVPSVEQETARDLVRAREDCPRRSDAGATPALEAAAAPGHRLLRRSRLDRQARPVAASTALRPCRYPAGLRVRLRGRAEHHSTSRPAGHRDRDDGRRQRVHRRRAPAGLSAGGLDPDCVRTGGRDRRLAPVHRQHHRLVRRAGAQRALLGVTHGYRGRSPRPATPTPGGCWSRLPGTTARAIGRARPCGTDGNSPHPPPGSAATPATAGYTPAGSDSPTARRGP